DLTHDEEPRYYVASRANWAPNVLVGRATFGYLAYDLTTGGLVYLKDFWRLDLPGIQKEGDIYRELEGKNVSNIAKLGRAGDTVNERSEDPYARFCQRSRSSPVVFIVEPYVHYRLVLNTLGKPLNQFNSTRQLCEVIRDAVIAHGEAYGKTGILHHDVSACNILIGDDGKGILIDWDLSKKLSMEGEGRPRRATRTGTWQFISMGLLMNPTSRPHELQDDLESFFWVLLYQIVQY
ncbi:kinase-like domain-containing protein, partial [Gloeopeniophorella convolvens]